MVPAFWLVDHGEGPVVSYHFTNCTNMDMYMTWGHTHSLGFAMGSPAWHLVNVDPGSFDSLSP